MTALDITLRPLAAALMERFGKTVTHVSVGTAVSYNPATGAASQSQTPAEVKAVVEDARGAQFAENLVQAGDKQISAAAAAFTAAPKPGDAFAVDASRYSVVQVRTTYSGDLPALYQVLARKA